MANSVDPNQSAPDSTKYFKKQLHIKQNLCKKGRDLSDRNFRTFTVMSFLEVNFTPKHLPKVLDSFTNTILGQF